MIVDDLSCPISFLPLSHADLFLRTKNILCRAGVESCLLSYAFVCVVVVDTGPRIPNMTLLRTNIPESTEYYFASLRLNISH